MHISDPPSSWAAGAYQDFSSSQIPESAAPRRRKSKSPELQSSQAVENDTQQQAQSSSGQPDLSASQPPADFLRKKSPEPSQWQPEEGDTSRTTEHTTEVSAAPTSSSEPTRSIPASFEQRQNNTVPDSQTLPDSSSFVPSGIETQSSLTSESRGRGRPPKEVTQVSGLSQTQGEDLQSSWQGLSSQPAGLSQAAAGPQFEDSQPRQSGTAPKVSQTAPADSGEEDQEPLQASTELPSGSLQQASVSLSQPEAPVHRTHEDSTQASQFATQLNGSVDPERRKDLSEKLPSQAEVQRSQPVASDNSAALIFNHADSTASATNTPVQSPSSPHIRSKSIQQASSNSVHSNNHLSALSANVAANSPDTDGDIRETTERPESNHVDLTTETQPPPGQTSSIEVTPLPARHTIAAQRNANTNLPAQSQPSPFPFQTQVSRHFTSTASDQPLRSQVASSQSHRLVQSQPSLGPGFEPSTAPAAFSSQLRSSSPLRPPPDESIRTFPFGESAPLRPSTPSSPVRRSSQSSAMDSSPASGSSAKEKMEALRAKHRAKVEANRAARSATPTSVPAPAAPATSPPKSSIPPHVTADTPALNPARLASPLLRAQEGPRSPSVVPAMEALPEITTEEMNTSERYPTLLPQASVGEGETQRNGSLTGRATPNQQQPSPPTDPETASVHAIPITLEGHQRDEYPQIVYYNQGLIHSFLETKDPDDKLIQRIKTFLDRVRAVCLHPDLNNAETATQYDVEPAQQAGWDSNCSSKFRFLKTLLGGLREENLHFAIALRRGRLVDILRIFLQGIDVSFIVPGATEAANHTGSGSLKVTILLEDTDASQVDKTDLIVGLDSRYRHDDPMIRALRQSNGQWCLFASLVVPRTIEHIENHLSPDLSELARLRALVSGIEQLKNKAGRSGEGQLSPTDSAKALVSYFKDPAPDKAWPLVELGSLEDLDSQTESEIEAPNTTSPTVGAKRQRTASDGRSKEDDLSKRVRVDPSAPEEAAAADIPTTINPQDVELTHISDSIDKLTQSGANEDTSNPAQTSTEKHLQRLLQDALTRNEELTSALSDLQYRHEDARTHLIRTTSERNDAMSTAETAITRMNAAVNRESSVRAERSDLKKELEEAKLSLLTHAIPERAEFESLRQALAQANAEKEALAKRLEQAGKDSEFFRAQYQDASTTAQGEVAANAELRNQLAVAENRATGEQAKLRQMGYDARTKVLEDENRKLKAVLRDREAGLKFRDEEIAKLKEASRGRMGTRGTSVPRSPRLASPMRSRQGSPAVGELRGKGAGAGGLLHPLRNNA